jgi:excisionase family DNA binding protein
VARVAGEDRLLTSAEVASLFKVETVTVLRWAHAGSLPFIRNPGPRPHRTGGR